MRIGTFAVILAVLALAVSGTTIAALLGVRALAATRLQGVAADLRGLAGGSIETTITVRQTLDLDAEIQIAAPTKIDLALDVDGKVPVNLRVRINKELKVPITMDIEEMIEMDSIVVVPEPTKVRARADIGLEQALKWRVARPLAPAINISGSIPLDQEIEIEFPDALRVKCDVPVHFPLQTDLLVPLEFDIPVDEVMDLRMAIQQQAEVGFPEPLLITGKVPVVMEIPVLIPLSQTPVGPSLEKVARALDGLLAP
jgi:hypothetical protein